MITGEPNLPMFNVVMSIEVDSPPGFVITLVTMNNSIWTRLYLLLVPFLVQSQMLLFTKNTNRLLTAIAVKLLILVLSSHVCVQIAPCEIPDTLVRCAPLGSSRGLKITFPSWYS